MARRLQTRESMDSFTFNKIAGAVLGSLLLLVGVRTLVDETYPTGEVSKPHGEKTVTPMPSQAAAPAAAPATPQDPPVATSLATADPEAGKKAMNQCAACHNWAKGGPNLIGPNLYGVVDRDIGKEPGYTYSSGVANKGGKWTFQDLYEWLKSPKSFIPGTKMAFGGVKSPKERANIIAYLDKQAGNPVPLPAK